MEELPGKFSESRIYFYAGFLYHIDGRYRDQIYRCVHRQTLMCRGKLFRNQDGIFTLLENHNHVENNTASNVIRAKSQMVHLAGTTSIDLREIYLNVCRE